MKNYPDYKYRPRRRKHPKRACKRSAVAQRSSSADVDLSDNSPRGGVILKSTGQEAGCSQDDDDEEASICSDPNAPLMSSLLNTPEGSPAPSPSAHDTILVPSVHHACPPTGPSTSAHMNPYIGDAQSPVQPYYCLTPEMSPFDDSADGIFSFPSNSAEICPSQSNEQRSSSPRYSELLRKFSHLNDSYYNSKTHRMTPTSLNLTHNSDSMVTLRELVSRPRPPINNMIGHVTSNPTNQSHMMNPISGYPNPPSASPRLRHLDSSKSENGHSSQFDGSSDKYYRFQDCHRPQAPKYNEPADYLIEKISRDESLADVDTSEFDQYLPPTGSYYNGQHACANVTEGNAYDYRNSACGHETRRSMTRFSNSAETGAFNFERVIEADMYDVEGINHSGFDQGVSFMSALTNNMCF